MQSKLETWYEISVLLKQTKEREAELRRELCKEFIGGSEMVNGRVTVKGNDHESNLSYKAVQALGYTIDKPVLSSLWPGMSNVERAVFKMEPKLQLRPYKMLPDSSIVHEAIVSKLAMPTLSIELGEA